MSNLTAQLNSKNELINEIYRILSAADQQPDHTLKELAKIVCALIEEHKSELEENQEPTEVKHPSHYRPGTYEAIKVILAWKLSFPLGNVVKYICRAGLKDREKTIEDLEKAAEYLNIEIEHRKSSAQ